VTRWLGCAFGLAALIKLAMTQTDRIAVIVLAVSVVFQIAALFDDRAERRDQAKRAQIADVVSLWKQDR
jgi:hypothetical protein